MTAHVRLARSIGSGLLACMAAVMVACGEQDSDSAGEGRKACTQIGCRSGVNVRFEALPAVAARVRVCVRWGCRSVSAEMRSMVFVPLPDCVADRRVDVQVLVRDRGGRRVGGAERRVRLARLRPNGPGCPPVCLIARLPYRGDAGSLIAARNDRGKSADQRSRERSPSD